VRGRRIVPPEDHWKTDDQRHAEATKEDGQYGRGIDKKAAVEALLLVSPEPLSVAELSELTGFEAGAVREILNELQLFYNERGGGLVIREVGGGYCFYSNPDTAFYVARLISSQVNPRLTRAALETMAIVAYLQPVSRGVIAEIRGVQSEGVIKTLEDRELVCAVGRGGPPGYPNLYGTTTRFLERFGLNSLDDLPDLEQFAPDYETIDRIKKSLSWEISGEGIGAGSGETREDTEDSGGGGDSFPTGGGEADH
jgi:segregation and condensation protein B